ncbi:MAG: DUF1844 domain-containing protein [Planctomycetota bacterium]|nr:DUF1844 domain-containing protein [Planctomycetota bacterium]
MHDPGKRPVHTTLRKYARTVFRHVSQRVLASEVLIHLGKHPNPVSQLTQVNLPAAKYTIDLLRILREKTKGNLTEREEALFEKLFEVLDSELEQSTQGED